MYKHSRPYSIDLLLNHPNNLIINLLHILMTRAKELFYICTRHRRFVDTMLLLNLNQNWLVIRKIRPEITKDIFTNII